MERKNDAPLRGGTDFPQPRVRVDLLSVVLVLEVVDLNVGPKRREDADSGLFLKVERR